MKRINVSALALVASCGLAAAQSTIWNFNGDFAASSGSGTLDWWNANAFGTFGTDTVGGGSSGVLNLPAASATQGLSLAHGYGPNGGGAYLNQYTLIMDVKDDITAGWSVYFQTNTNNTNDGDAFRNPANGIGISGDYEGLIVQGQWHRVAFVINLADAGPNRMRKYIDGNYVGSTGLGEGIDGRWSLDPTVLLFADNDGDTSQMSVSSILFENRAWTDGEIASIGGPSAGGITGPVGSVPPSITAFVSPCGPAGATAYVTAIPVSGQNPNSTSYTIRADLSSVGLGASIAMVDNGTNGDAAAGDGIYTTTFTIPPLAPATYPLNVTVTDNLNRSASSSTGLIIYQDPAGSGTNATQVDFDADPAPSGTFASTFGPGYLEFWDGLIPGGTQGLAIFGTTSSLGIPNINGQEAGVMFLPALFSGEGLRFNTLSPGNGGGVWTNVFTLGYDLYIPSAQSLPPVRIPFIETNNENANGGDFWGRFDNFSLGYQGDGVQAEAWSSVNAFQFDRWHRIVITSDTSQCTARGTIFVDGVEVFNGPIPDSTDNKYALYSTTDGDPAPPEPDLEAYAFILSDVNARTCDLYINSFYFVDRVLAPSEIQSLGGANAAGFFAPPPQCDPDVNCDGVPDQGDVACIILAVAGDMGCFCQADPDFNHDGVPDQGDVADVILSVAGAPCP